MKFNVKSIVAGMIMGCVLTSGVSVFAYNGSKTIQASFKNIKIFVDGAELTPRDSNGNVLEPFIYNGSTYMPVRAVAEAVGKDVSYDANSNSVYIGSGNSSSTSVTKGTALKPYQTENRCWEDDSVSMGGVKYKDGLYLGYGGSDGGSAYYNLSGQYTTVSGLYGPVDGTCSSGDSGIVRFYGDGILLAEYKVVYGNLPKNFTVNVTGVTQLVIEYDKDGQDAGLGSIAFK